MDLLGRKVTMKNGKALTLFLEELSRTSAEAEAVEALTPSAGKLRKAAAALHEVTSSLVGVALQGDVDRFLADATLYLEFAGIVCAAWQWLLQGLVARRKLDAGAGGAEGDFLEGKLFVMRYFFEYELPKTEGLRSRLMNPDGLTVNMKPEHFED